MGVVDKAGVHGVVPDDRVFAVNYPGYPSSLARATQTLGGEKRIAEARSSDSNYLELKFRPEDPCAHAAFGELQQTSDLLLRIKRKPRRNLLKSCVSGTTDTAPGSSSPGYEVSADIIARVENTYNFEGMADYQYVLAVHVDAAKRGQKRRNAEEHFEKRTLTDMEQEELMMLVPPLFSIKDIPEETVLRPSDFTNKKTKRKNLGDSTLQMEVCRLASYPILIALQMLHQNIVIYLLCLNAI